MSNVDTDITIYRASLVKIRQDVPSYVSFGKGTQDFGAQSFQLIWTDFSSHVTPTGKHYMESLDAHNVLSRRERKHID